MYAKPELWLVNDARHVILEVGGGPDQDNSDENLSGPVIKGALIGLD